MTNQENQLASILGDIESDHPKEKEYGKKRATEEEYQRNNKSQ